jgi:hypothetical protein
VTASSASLLCAGCSAGHRFGQLQSGLARLRRTLRGGVDRERQHRNLLTYVLMVESLALHRYSQRASDPPPTAAA